MNLVIVELGAGSSAGSAEVDGLRSNLSASSRLILIGKAGGHNGQHQ